MESNNTPATDRFETVLNFALDALQKGGTIEDAKAEIITAADRLLEDSAMEMVEAPINGVCYLLLQIYKTGKYPGKSPNPLMDELQQVLVEAKRLKDAKDAKDDEDHSAADTY